MMFMKFDKRWFNTDNNSWTLQEDIALKVMHTCSANVNRITAMNWPSSSSDGNNTTVCNHREFILNVSLMIVST